MMASLLSIFDPSSSTILMNWCFGLVWMLIPLSRFWVLGSSYHVLMTKLMEIVGKVLKSKFEFFFTSLFLFLLIINVTGLFPYAFSISSHFTVNFVLGLTLWLTTMTWGWTKSFNHMLAHLTPMGCPFVLVPFMVLVELISVIIRPLTLSLRLMSNMLAGHMILSLLSESVYFLSSLTKPMFFFLELGFFSFEIGVAFIQTYVFTSLIMLYWSENQFN